MKKIVILVLTLLMMVLMLTSCGNESSSFDKVEPVSQTQNSDDANSSPDRSEQADQKKQAKNNDYLCFTALEPGSTVAMESIYMKQEGDETVASLQYSLDQKNWQEFLVDQTEITLEKEGDKVYFRGNNPKGPGRNYFVMTGKLAGSGNIMSLLDAEKFNELTTVPPGAFAETFYDCDSLVVAPMLPATKLAVCCYKNMFYNCDSLTATPELPATELAEACYENMFRDCTSLTVVPELPATELAEFCYSHMFAGCTSLETAPVLPATKLAWMCYDEMFVGCEALKVAPTLPATELADSCYYYMFSGCTALMVAPELPATKLAECCYVCMFNNCTSLKSIEVGFDSFADIPDDATYEWLDGVAENGIFTWAGGNTCADRGEDTIPEGWTIVSAG